MKIKELAKSWNKDNSDDLSLSNFNVQLNKRDAAKVLALAEMYSHNQTDQIIADLISAALKELETTFPYVKGTKVIGEDELGDPLYEDEGPTPIYLALAKKHYQKLQP